MKSGFDLILPFVKPLEPFLKDEDVSEIMVNADGSVHIERHGRLLNVGLNITEHHRATAARNIARILGDDIDESMPLLDARLPDGSRVAAVTSPASVGGTILCIRKFRSKHFSAEELVRVGMLSMAQLVQLAKLIRDQQTILISGGTGSGKTTLLNALSAFLPKQERIVVIEDTAELSIQSENMVRLEAQRAQDKVPAVSIRDLLRQTLRLRPDRIILGEVRGAEAFDLLQALNTGHRGSLSTIHANSAKASVDRFRTCISMAGENLPDRAITANIADAIQVLVHVSRRSDGCRSVDEILKLGKYDDASKQYGFEDLSFEEWLSKPEEMYPCETSVGV